MAALEIDFKVRISKLVTRVEMSPRLGTKGAIVLITIAASHAHVQARQFAREQCDIILTCLSLCD
jgi:hypothetical protein